MEGWEEPHPKCGVLGKWHNLPQFPPVLASPSDGGCKAVNEIMTMEAITQRLAHSYCLVSGKNMHS